MKFKFVLVNKAGRVVAGPFTTIDAVAKNVDWNKVTLKVTEWTDTKYGKFV